LENERCIRKIVRENFGKIAKKCGKKILGEIEEEKKTWEENLGK
jgi:hypothetical protein